MNSQPKAKTAPPMSTRNERPCHVSGSPDDRYHQSVRAVPMIAATTWEMRIPTAYSGQAGP